MTKGIDTKAKIIDKSLELFHSRGYYSTSMNDIIEITGVKKGNLYFHFNSKEELALETLKRAQNIYEKFINSRIHGITAYEKVCSVIDAIVEFHITRGEGRGCIFGNMALESGDDGSVLSQFTQSVFRGWECNISGIISRGVESGEIKMMETPESMARIITAQLEGGVMLSKLYSDYKHLHESAEFIKSVLIQKLNVEGTNAD